MRKRVQSIISILCALVLLLGCAPMAMGEGTDAVTFSVITVQWDDANDQDGVRPGTVTAALVSGGTEYDSVTLNEENNWTGMLAAPAFDGETPVSYQWKLGDVGPYTAALGAPQNGTTVATLTHEPETVSIAVQWTWQNDQNATGKRPDRVNVQLLADGVPCTVATLNADNSWTENMENLPANAGGASVAYTLAEPQVTDYTVQVSGSAEAGFTVTAALETGTLTVSRQITGAPAGTDPSKLSYTVSGPDSRLPATVSAAEYVLENAAPGSYLVKENYQEGAAPGYTLDAAQSVTTAAARVEGGKTAQVTLKNVFVKEKKINGQEKEGAAPPAADLSKLTFIIDGPDPSMPQTVYYSQFQKGEFTLSNIQCGTYTVIETNAGTLLNEYSLVISDSNQGILVQVNDDTAKAKLVNVYEKNVPVTPAPKDGKISIPVVKTWVDNDNQDGNRPESVKVRLLANGKEVSSAVLDERTGWSHVFEDLPKLDGKKQPIVYTVTEDPVPLYDSVVSGGSIINVYHPELTSATVKKIWKDDNNKSGRRPDSIYAVLSDGTRTVATVVLTAANNWTATVENLPTVVNGKQMKYTWKEQEVLGYQKVGVEITGDLTTFTNKLYERKTPPPGTKGPKHPGTPYLIIEEYGTPLGVEIIINHVGDCFD